MSRFSRQDPWAELTKTSNTNDRRVFDDNDDESTMQMARRPQQSSHPSQSISGALTLRPTEHDRPAQHVESWRDEKRDDDLSGAMSRMRVCEPLSPPPRRCEREAPRRPAPRQRAPSPSPSPPPPRRHASPPPLRTRRAPSPDWNEGEPVRIHQPRCAAPAPRSPSPGPARRRRNPSPLNNPFDDSFGVRRRTRNHLDLTSSSSPTRSRAQRPPPTNANSSTSYSYSVTATSYSTGNRTTSRTQSIVNARRMRDTYPSTRHQAGMQHDPGCPFCFETQGEAVRAAAAWSAEGEDCWVEWDAHGLGLWGVVFDVDRCGGSRAPGGGEWWYS